MIQDYGVSPICIGESDRLHAPGLRDARDSLPVDYRRLTTRGRLQNKWNLEKLKEILTYQNDLLSDLLQKADDDRREKLKSEKGGLARVKDQGVRALEKALRAGASSAVMVLLKAKVEAAEWWQGYADATIPGATKLVLWSSTCITFFASFNKGISSSYTAHNF